MNTIKVSYDGHEISTFFQIWKSRSIKRWENESWKFSTSSQPQNMMMNVRHSPQRSSVTWCCRSRTRRQPICQFCPAVPSTDRGCTAALVQSRVPHCWVAAELAMEISDRRWRDLRPWSTMYGSVLKLRWMVCVKSPLQLWPLVLLQTIKHR